VARHVSATWQKLHSQQLPRSQNMPNQLNSGARDLFQTIFFYSGVFQIIFFTGIIIIFKPLINLKSKKLFVIETGVSIYINILFS